MRRLNRTDRLLDRLDRALRFAVAPGMRSHGRVPTASPPLAVAEQRAAARLMRVNLAGEIAAQALYRGQAWRARNPEMRQRLEQAAAEEQTHLLWCTQRLAELGGRPSLLNPLWHLGSLAIGAAAGLAGDRASLGFVAETERQVVRHLDDHLGRLPAADTQSRAVLEAMRADEAEHGSAAEQAGGIPLPAAVRRLMACAAGVMTRTAFWI